MDRDQEGALCVKDALSLNKHISCDELAAAQMGFLDAATNSRNRFVRCLPYKIWAGCSTLSCPRIFLLSMPLPISLP